MQFQTPWGERVPVFALFWIFGMLILPFFFYPQFIYAVPSRHVTFVWLITAGYCMAAAYLYRANNGRKVFRLITIAAIILAAVHGFHAMWFLFLYVAYLLI